jgi:hypothetical protein
VDVVKAKGPQNSRPRSASTHARPGPQKSKSRSLQRRPRIGIGSATGRGSRRRAPSLVRRFAARAVRRLAGCGAEGREREESAGEGAPRLWCAALPREQSAASAGCGEGSEAQGVHEAQGAQGATGAHTPPLVSCFEPALQRGVVCRVCRLRRVQQRWLRRLQRGWLRRPRS